MAIQIISLTETELLSLTNILSRGQTRAREQTRGRILDLSHRGHHPGKIAKALKVCRTTVYSIRKRYLAEGLTAALKDKPPSGRPPVITGDEKARITALACSDAPERHASWSLRLLADKAVEMNFVEGISHTGIAKILKKTL